MFLVVLIHICHRYVSRPSFQYPLQLSFDICKNYSSSQYITVHGVQRRRTRNGEAGRKNMMLMCLDIGVRRRKVTKSFLEETFTMCCAKKVVHIMSQWCCKKKWLTRMSIWLTDCTARVTHAKFRVMLDHTVTQMGFPLMDAWGSL